MKLLGSTAKNENSKNVPHLEITKVVLINRNIFNNDYQKNSRVFFIFVPNEWFGQLLGILPKNVTFSKTFNSEFLYIKVRSTDQNSKPPEIEDKINSTLLIN